MRKYPFRAQQSICRPFTPQLDRRQIALRGPRKVWESNQDCVRHGQLNRRDQPETLTHWARLWNANSCQERVLSTKLKSLQQSKEQLSIALWRNVWRFRGVRFVRKLVGLDIRQVTWDVLWRQGKREEINKNEHWPFQEAQLHHLQRAPFLVAETAKRVSLRRRFVPLARKSFLICTDLVCLDAPILRECFLWIIREVYLASAVLLFRLMPLGCLNVPSSSLVSETGFCSWCTWMITESSQLRILCL